MPQTKLSTQGLVIFPNVFRIEDGLEPGETFDVERTKPGEYVFRRKDVGGRRKEGSTGLTDALLACPVKGWFEPIPDNGISESPRSPFE